MAKKTALQACYVKLRKKGASVGTAGTLCKQLKTKCSRKRGSVKRCMSSHLRKITK